MAGSHPHKRAAAAAVSIVTFVAALAAVWLAPRVSDAVAAWLQAPPVRSRTVTLGVSLPVTAAGDAAPAGRRVAPSQAAAPGTLATAERLSPVVTVDAGLRFTMVGVVCDPPGGGELAVRLRVSDDGARWSRWYATELERGGEPGAPRQAYTEPIWTGLARYVELAAASAGDGAPAALHGVRVVALNSTGDAGAGDVMLGVVRRTAAAIAGLHVAAPAAAMTTAPDIVSRAQWGANESLRSGTPAYATVKMAFVHHTDGSNNYTRGESAAIVRGIYYYHTQSLHWSDIGYNFLIDRFGTVYEGRYGGTNRGPIGAQVLGFNTGSTGIALMGNYVDTAPTSAALASLKRLLAWKLDVHHVDPLGKATLVCGYGQKFATGERVSFNAIAGHRDANFTACPGDRLYALLPALRRAVSKIGLPKIYDFAVAPEAISPDGDGVQDKTAMQFTVSEAADWHVEVRDAAGTVVRTFAGKGATVAFTWGGNDDQGRPVPDGVYKLTAGATTPTGAARKATCLLTVDRVPPTIQGATVTPDPFSPNGDGHSDLASLRFQPGEPGSCRVSVLDADGAVARMLRGWHAVTSGVQTVTWDGRVGTSGSLTAAGDGSHTLRVELRDPAGNHAAVRQTVTVDRTLGFPTVSPRISSPNGDGVRDTLTFGFKLTRRATVTVGVLRGTTLLDTLRPGTLAAGTQRVVWDGKLPDDAWIGSGTYRCRVRADSAVGGVAVNEPFTVDRYRQRLSAAATAAVRLGKSAAVTYKVRDPYSPTVRVTVVVTDAAGSSVASVDCGWVTQAASHTCKWRPAKRGVYTLTFGAVDRGGNHEKAKVVTALTVR
jgi:hypothetical protein